ncbi:MULTISPECIES: DUF4232 domain-containing protein [unclassified Arthrobacter]|uniref:DUF4232 domain-containing protein n=1 Tax=unclassified Arthrobacter TaxID=235627 RepID=UPI00159E6559|nr:MULTISPECIES: DUF4232 domain-containing protein [unclassified Arthrobacter]MCQ9164990.1 DUF4232 domain-containing protein [Arthrobacter sp. STN4]NVM98946.1 DUF4232 domain-containing protein [Arthrobacter sp. SDTb3-6]
MTSAQNDLPGTASPRHAKPAKPAFRHRSAALLGLVAVLGLAVAGCAPTGGSGTATTAAGPATASSATAGNTPSSMASTAPTPAAPSSAAPATTMAPALCKAADLKGSLDDTGGGAAGHIYMKLILTNKSSSACILDGYPGVSLVKAGTTQPIGAPADRDTSRPSSGPIHLAPGQGASAVLRYTQADNYQDCQRVQADDVMVYPPSAYDELVIAHPLTACSNANDNLLLIGAFQP